MFRCLIQRCVDFVVLSWIITQVTLPGAAQPAKTPPSGAQLAQQQAEQAALEAFKKLRLDKQNLEQRDTLAAIGEYQKFYEDQGYLYPGVGVELSSYIARLYLIELHDKNKALEIYDWAVGKFKSAPGWERLWKEREQLKGGSSLLAPATSVVSSSLLPALPVAVNPVKAPPGLWTSNSLATVQPVPGGTAPHREAAQPVPQPERSFVSVSATQVDSIASLTVRRAAPFLSSLSTKSAAPIGESSLHQALLTQLKTGVLSAAEAFGQKAITSDIALRWLDSKTLRWPDDGRLANALIEAVVKNEPEKLERAALRPLSTEARVRIGDYFSAKADRRAVEIYQDVMNVPVKAGGVPDWYGQAGARLGAFFEAQGQFDKALEAYLDVVEKLPKDGGYGVNAAVHAARIYLQRGEESNARKLYEEVIAYKSEMHSVLVIGEQAGFWMKEQRLDRVKELIRPFIHSAPQPSLQSAVALSIGAHAFYISGEWQQSKEFATKSLAQAKLLQRTNKNSLWIDEAINTAEVVLARIAAHDAAPLTTDDELIKITVYRGDTKHNTYVATLTLRASLPLQVVAKSDNELLALKEGGDWRWQEDMLAMEKNIIVEVSGKRVEDSFDTEVQVRCPQSADYLIKVPVRVRVVNRNP